MVTRIMVKLGASVDESVEKEDLWGQKGDPKETSNKTQGGGLFASTSLGGARDQTVRTRGKIQVGLALHRERELKPVLPLYRGED